MVVRSERRADRVFYALSDPTRRDIVRRTAGPGLSVSALADRYPMSFAAVQKHVAVLERAGLVTKQVQGRERIVRSNTEAIHHARDLLGQLEEVWRARMERFEETLNATVEGARR
jgi:DNA-binding transcriptional ArsR family regulator